VPDGGLINLEIQMSNKLQENRLIRRKEVQAATGLSFSSIYALVEKKEFPAPVKLSERRVAWVESEVQEWLDNRMGNRNKGYSPETFKFEQKKPKPINKKSPTVKSKSSQRITKTYTTYDCSTLDDFLCCVMATVEDGFLLAGLVTNVDYTASDLIASAIPIVQDQWRSGKLSITTGWPS